MGSGASHDSPAGGGTSGHLTSETDSTGRRRLVYEYGGRRYDVSEFLAERNRERQRQSKPTLTETTPPAPEEPVAKPDKFTITNIDVSGHLKQNRLAHHTDEYDSKDLILRRGQVFEFNMTFDRPYNKDTDKIFLEFATGQMPSYTKGTKMRFFLSDVIPEDKWGAMVSKEEGTTMTIKVQSSCNCPIGYYSMSVVTVVGENGVESEFRLTYPEKVYFIFNPWCKSDAVYMEEEDGKDEYVLNETGYQFYGNSRYVKKRPWNFGQFEDSVFDAAIYLLQDCKEPVTDFERNNPIIISRKMSAAINVQDDGGVLVGNWSGNYSDGIRPTAWNGSVAILEQYMKNKEPVCYGQCWVFSGVLTTILRTLGIPARSVTNFASAHDTDSSMTIDKHFDVDGEPVEWMDSDSVWNFHVWNDCWMTRPDLPAGYGGWQAVDSTPQETSEGIFQTGPASLNAIKQGHVYLPYDGRFVFAEINGDRMTWEVSESPEGYQDLKKIKTDTASVGKLLYTKTVGKHEGEDVKEQYKYKGGSAEERMSVETAVQSGSKPDTFNPEVHTDDDITEELYVKDENSIFVGDDFDVCVKLGNKSADERNVSMSLIVQACYYTGVLAEKVKKERRDVVVTSGQSTETVFNIKVSEYIDKLVDQTSMKIFLLGKVKETGQILVEQDDFRLRTPNIDVSVPNTKLRVNQRFTATLTVKNPLPVTLTNSTYNLEGAGLQRQMVISLGIVAPHAEIKRDVTLTARKPGKRTLLVDFDSDQLSQVHGDVEIEIS